MTNSLIPYSFIPGTKALASEVNANFIALANAVAEGKTFTTESIEEFNTTLEATLEESLGDRLETNLSNSKNISNCILEMPQNIKYDINSSGAVRLQEGSKVYVSTSGTFEAVTLDASTSYGGDELWTTDHSRKLFLVYIPATNSVTTQALEYTYSQSSAPTNFLAGSALWYDTNNHIIKSTYDSGSTWQVCSLPIMVGRPGETDIGWHGYVDNIFNGMGFIGTFTFVLPGVRYLIPNGRNADGTLKNLEVKIDTCTLVNLTTEVSVLGQLTATKELMAWGTPYYFVGETEPTITTSSVLWYDTNSNFIKKRGENQSNWQVTSVAVLPKLIKTASSANITDISTPKPVLMVTGMEIKDAPPDPAKAVTQAFNTTYVAQEDGWLYSFSLLTAVANNQGAGGTSIIDVSTTIDGVEVYHNKAQCSWDNKNNTVSVTTGSANIVPIYCGQTYKMFQDFKQNTGNISMSSLVFYPLKK